MRCFFGIHKIGTWQYAEPVEIWDDGDYVATRLLYTATCQICGLPKFKRVRAS